MKPLLRLCVLIVCAGIVCLAGVALAQDEEVPLSNWTAPPYWGPAVQRAEGEPGGAMVAHGLGMTAQAEALPSSPLPFVAIAPCRIVDTRVAVSDGFHQPNFADNEARTFNFPASPDCPGLPATAGAYSLNVQFRPISQLSFITLFPTGTTMPTVSTLTASPAAWVEDAAIVPAGTGGAINVYCQFAGRVVIDINGYYGPQSVVTSLNTLTGDVTLAQGSNVTITPSGNTLTIAAAGAQGPIGPTGAQGPPGPPGTDASVALRVGTGGSSALIDALPSDIQTIVLTPETAGGYLLLAKGSVQVNPTFPDATPPVLCQLIATRVLPASPPMILDQFDVAGGFVNVFSAPIPIALQGSVPVDAGDVWQVTLTCSTPGEPSNGEALLAYPRLAALKAGAISQATIPTP